LFQPPILLVACGKVNKRDDYQNNSGGAGVRQHRHAWRHMRRGRICHFARAQFCKAGWFVWVGVPAGDGP